MTTNTPPPDPDWSRRYRVQPGADFIEAIWLDGYEHQSIWGYDTGMVSFFAQVWPNDSTSEQPELWLTPPTQQMSWPQMIVPQLVDFTGEDPLPIVRAMGIAAPAPAVVDSEELTGRLAECGHRPTTEYTQGEIVALEWLLGNRSPGPSSGSIDTSDGERPTADVVDAEASYATGMVYLTQGQYMSGIEGALVASIRPAAEEGSAR
jgi:hypothetical protein